MNIQRPQDANDCHTITSHLFEDAFKEHIALAQDVQKTLGKVINEAVALCIDAIRNGGKIMFFGNGGSASDAQHLATELTVRFQDDRPALPALALTTDTSTLTAIANDFSFDQIFARQIEALGKPEDIAIGITTSGTSPNVIEGIKTARRKGLKTIVLTGKSGGSFSDKDGLIIKVPSTTTARIQEMHITLGQVMCLAIEKGLGF